MNALTTPVRPSAILKLICSATALILVSACDSRPPDTLATAPVATSVGTKIDDGIVTARVKSALLADADVKSFDLKVETRKGEVMLSGFVGNQAHVDRAILVTRGVEGVQLVTNNMTLKDGPATIGNTVDDGIITAKVRSALLGDPAIKSFDIAVVTRKGEAQLSGFVDSQTQIDRASELARAVEGVKSVANEMSVKK
ncbi:MAG: BON domain-containing protein [Sulfuritalea sp.]|nr:BON domain-containing protein [Sulfuritalea sp.]